MKKQAFPKELVPLALQTNEKLQNYLYKQGRINLLIHSLYLKHGKYIKRFLNYDVIAEAFNQEFFLKNYTKALLLFYTLYKMGYSLDSELFDVGSGATPGGIAFSQVRQHLGFEAPMIKILDKSKIQLNLAKKYCEQNDIQIDKILKKRFQIDNADYDSMLFFSYFICEQGRSFIKELYRHREYFKHGFAVVDYQQTVERIERTFQKNGCYRIISVYRCFALPEPLQTIFHEKEVFVNGCFYEPRKN